jgi:hypothetical protein
MIGGSSPGRGWEFFSSPPRPDRFWGPPSLLSNVYHGLFPCGYSGRGVNLTTNLHLVSRSKNEWSYTFTPQYAFTAWYSVKHKENFTFTFTFHYDSVARQLQGSSHENTQFECPFYTLCFNRLSVVSTAVGIEKV